MAFRDSGSGFEVGGWGFGVTVVVCQCGLDLGFSVVSALYQSRSDVGVFGRLTPTPETLHCGLGLRFRV